MSRALLEGEAVLREVLEWEVGLQALHQRIAGRFSRSESRQRVLSYLKGLLGSVERKNGWQLAEHAGDATPDGVSAGGGLAVYNWDADAVRDDLQGYVVEHLGDPGAVLVVDETGFLKQGRKSVGAKRQYSGTAGKVENCQIGVFLAYGSCYGAAFLDRELYLPQEWVEDMERRQEAGVPEGVVFRTKAQLAQGMIARVVSAGVPFGWVAGDTVYGNDRRLRRWLEEQGLPYLLAVKSNEPLWADTERGSTQVAARELAQQIPDDQWQRLSAGDESKGPRLYDWGRLQVRPWSEPDQGHWLLVRRPPAADRRSRRPGLLRLFWGGGSAAGRTGAGGGQPLDHRRCLQRSQAGSGSGRIRGAPLGRMVPAHHPGPPAADWPMLSSR